MMKGYYLFAPMEAGCIGPSSGVEKKIRNFCKVIAETNDIELKILPLPKYSSKRLVRIINRWLPLTPAAYDWRKQQVFEDAEFIYIRMVEHDATFLNFLKRAKKKNQNLKIIYEIPTYPYEKELKVTLGNFPKVCKERFYRRFLRKYVDRIVTFYEQNSILGIPTIRVMNGYSFKEKKDWPTYSIHKDGSIHIIEVSTTASWHGYDRMIEGLRLYYQNGGKSNIIFHMVGSELPEHVELVKKYDLDTHVVFHGLQSGQALNEIYSQCSMGVDVLGGHRKDYPKSSSLKSREYAEHGLPVITSSPIDFLPKDYKYQLICPYDDSPIDIDQVISFYHSIFDDETPQDVYNHVFTYAKEHCDFHVTLRPIIDFIEG